MKFTDSRGTWSQQGKKLVGSGAVGAADQGMRSRCPPTAIRPSSEARVTVLESSVPFGLGPAGAAWVSYATRGSGRSKARSWSAAALREPPGRAHRRLTADGKLRDPRRVSRRRRCGHRTSLPAMEPFGRKVENSSAVARWESLLRPLRCPLIAASLWSADLTITGESERRGRLRNELGTGFRSKSW